MASFKQFLIGAAFIGLSFATGGAFGAGATKLGTLFFSVGAGQILQSLGAPGAPLKQQREGILVQSVNTQNALPIIYGTPRAAGKIVFQDTRDTSRGPNTRLDMVAAFCLGNREPAEVGSGAEAEDPDNGDIGGFGSVFFDERQAFDETGAPTEFLTDDLEFDHAAAFYPHLGAHDQAADDYMIETALLTAENAWGSGSTWTSDYKGQGVAYGVFALRGPKRVSGETHVHEDTALTRVFPGSVPNITAIIQGRKLYDPRTEGWAFSDNLVLCIRDYLLEPKVGGRLKLAQIDDTNFAAMADVADSPVIAIFGKKWICNGVLDTEKSVLTNLQELLFTGGLFLVYEGGVFKLKHFDVDATPVDFILDESNIIGDWSLSTNDPSDRVNVVTVHYVNGSLYNATELADQVLDVQVPSIGSANNYLTADGDFEIPREINLPYVTDSPHASIRGGQELVRSRNDLTVSLTASEEAVQLSLFDVVKLTHREFSMTAKKFFVVGIGLNFDDTVSLALREVESGAGVPAIAGGDSPTLNFSIYCTHFDAGDLYPGTNSFAETGVNVTWGDPPAEDATHADYKIDIRRGPCENFDFLNSVGISSGFDCGYATQNFQEAFGPQPWKDGYQTTLTGGPASSKVCSVSDSMDEAFYKARWTWTNPVTGLTENGPISSAVEGPSPAALADA